MKIKNLHKLPGQVVRAVEKGCWAPKAGRYSASMLTKSPRAHWLAVRHWDDLEKDVSEMLWSLMGSSFHSVLEKGQGENDLTEERLSVQLDLPTGPVKFSGVCDLYTDGNVYDWKTGSAWTAIYMDQAKIMEWESQLNAYAFLYHLAGFPVKSLNIVLFMRDWQNSKARREANYPRLPMELYQVHLWPFEDTERYIRQCITSLEKHRDTPDDELPVCSPEYRWAKKDTWAVKKSGNIRARKVCDSEVEAESILKAGEEIEYRQGDQFVRCRDYCDASEFCSFYKELNYE